MNYVYTRNEILIKNMSEYLTALCEKYPAVKALLQEFDREPLRVYLEQAVHKPLSSILPAEDLPDKVGSFRTFGGNALPFNRGS